MKVSHIKIQYRLKHVWILLIVKKNPSNFVLNHFSAVLKRFLCIPALILHV